MDAIDINPAVPGRIDGIDIGARRPRAVKTSMLTVGEKGTDIPCVVVFNSAPDNADDRPDGTIYIQSEVGMYVKSGGVYQISSDSRSRAASGITSHRIAGVIQQLAGAGVTFDNVISCKKPFYGTRIQLRNPDTTGPVTVIAKVAAQAVLSTNGAALNWVSLTKDGNTSITIPAATEVLNTGSPNQVVDGVVWCDICPIQSLVRTDIVDAAPLLRMRLYSASNLKHGTLNTILSGWTETGDYCAATRATADNVTNTAVSMIPTATGTIYIPYGQVDFYTGGKAGRIVVFGDSLSAGANFSQPGGAGTPYTGGNTMHWAISCRKAFAGLGYPNIQVAPCAIGGQKRDVTDMFFQANVADYKPDIAIFWNFSVNSDAAGTGGVTHVKYLIPEIEFCKRNNITPVVCTMHSSTFAERDATLGLLKDTGVTVLDFATVLATSPTNAVINPAYTMDGTHTNALGSATLAAYAAPKLLALL